MVSLQRSTRDGAAATATAPVAPRKPPGVGKRTLVREPDPGATAAADPARPVTPRPLPADFRARMEQAFGADFSRVRVREHPDVAARGAVAYTEGSEILFAPGRYDPDSRAGQELLGHELAHVVQQAGPGTPPAHAEPRAAAAGHGEAALEHEADTAGARAVRGEAAPVTGTGAPARQYMLTKCLPPGMVDDQFVEDDLEEAEVIPVGCYLRDTATGLVYRYVSSYPGHDTVVLRAVVGGGLFAYAFHTDLVTPHDVVDHDRALGQQIVDGMDAINNDNDHARGVHYEHTYQQDHPQHWQHAYLGGYANPQYFVKHAPMIWELVAGQSAAAGLRAWLAGLTIAECGTVLVALQLRSLLQVLGDDRFDAMFGNTHGVAPTEHLLRITARIDVCIPGHLLAGAGTTQQGGAVLKLGAKYYFNNHSAYLRKHPDGPLRGENSVYVGNNRFSGFGIDNVTFAQMCQTLCDGYNQARTPGDYQRLLLEHSSVPDHLVRERRQQGFSWRQLHDAWVEFVDEDHQLGGETPDQLDLHAWLNDPETGIDGQGVTLDTAAMLQLLTHGM